MPEPQHRGFQKQCSTICTLGVKLVKLAKEGFCHLFSGLIITIEAKKKESFNAWCTYSLGETRVIGEDNMSSIPVTGGHVSCNKKPNIKYLYMPLAEV